MKELEKANEYLKENIGRVSLRFRPRYHFSPPIGWMNDPNGVCYYRGALHIFYQYYPYDTVWGSMYWGHASTEDHCVFRHHPIALAPDFEDETGCFSGGALVKGNELLLFYTRHYEKDGVIKETQGMAKSRDGICFTKEPNPIIGENLLPEGFDTADFRDPNPAVLPNGKTALFVGAQSNKSGQVLVYETEDLKTYRFLSVIESPYFGKMGECPDYFRLDGKDVLIFSACALKEEENRFRNVNSSLYMVGKFDEKTGKFYAETVDEIDCGHKFYAPQTGENERGERVMTAWMEMWQADYFLHAERQGFNGALIYPRKLSLKNGRLYQTPVEGLEKYYVPLGMEENEVGKCFDMTFLVSEGGCVRLSDPKKRGNGFSFGLSGGKAWCDFSELDNEPRDRREAKFDYGNQVKIRALCDVSSLELFIDDGRETFTERHYIDSETLSVERVRAECKESHGLCLPQECFEIKGKL